MEIIQRIIRSLRHRLTPVQHHPRTPLPMERSPLRTMVFGLGVMGQTHAKALADSNLFQLAATTSRDPSKRQLADQLGCQHIDSHQICLDADAIDVLLVATPHASHQEITIKALRAGIHVICEKPMAITVADCDAMIEAADRSTATLTVVSQNRFEPSYRSVKAILDVGDLGHIRRCSITETFYRPNSYYQSADWRGTWAGEGGGVLMNQAPHVIDRYRWLCGRPDEVTSVCDTVLHPIEVEDTASLLLRHDNGIQGFIHISTNECPPMSRLEIACDRGRITVDDGAVTVHRLNGSIAQHAVSADPGSPAPQCTTEHRGGHLWNWSPELLHLFYEDFAEAIWNGRSPEVTAEQARDVVEIINAAHLSSHHQRHVRLPVDRNEYDTFQAAKVR